MLQLVLDDEPPGDAPRAPAVATWQDEHGRVFARAYGGPDLFDLIWTGIGRLTFARKSPLVTLRVERDVDHDTAADRFARFAQPIVLQALGYETLHASAVRTRDGVLAFCGVSGAGKSTLAYALGRRAGIDQVADDALVIVDAARGLVQPLPFEPRLRPASRVLETGERTPSSASPAVHLAAVFMLDVEPGDPPVTQRVPAHEAFAALLTHAHCFDPRDRPAVERMVHHYLALAAIVPLFTLRYPRDLSRIDALCDAVLAAAQAAPIAHAAGV